MSLAARFAADETIYTAWSAIPDAVTIEALAATSFDSVLLDMQHGGHSEESILRTLSPILAAGKPGIVRIPVGRFDMASRALDYGAEAVVAPMINSVEDARAFAASMKYPPLGERSWGASIAALRTGQYDMAKRLRDSNTETLAFAMIETRRAFDIADDILAVPGIDAIFIGPADLSIAWSNGENVNPSNEDMIAGIADLTAKARKAGKHVGIYLVDMALAGRYRDMGIRLFGFGTEAMFMATGANALLTKAKATYS